MVVMEEQGGIVLSDEAEVLIVFAGLFMANGVHYLIEMGVTCYRYYFSSISLSNMGDYLCQENCQLLC